METEQRNPEPDEVPVDEQPEAHTTAPTSAQSPDEIVEAPSPSEPDPVDDGVQDLNPDQPAIEGLWVDVVTGPNAGRRGSYLQTLTKEQDGTPKTILIRSRDERNELLEVAYADARLATRYTGGR